MENETESRSVMSDSLQPRGLYSPWNFPGQNPGEGSLSLLWRISPTQGSDPGLLHSRQILYLLSHKRSPRILEWVAYPFSSGFSRPRNWARVSCTCGSVIISGYCRPGKALHSTPKSDDKTTIFWTCSHSGTKVSLPEPKWWQKPMSYPMLLYLSSCLLFPDLDFPSRHRQAEDSGPRRNQGLCCLYTSSLCHAISKDCGRTPGTGEGSAQRTGKLHSVKESKYLFSGGMHPSSTFIPCLHWLPSLISININIDDKKTYWKDLREEQTSTHHDKNKPGTNNFALEEWPWHFDLPWK